MNIADTLVGLSVDAMLGTSERMELMGRLCHAVQESGMDLGEDPFPLSHEFANGVYVRTMTAPADALLIGKIHRVEHFTAILSGDISVFSESATRRVTAPLIFLTPAGARRVGYTHRETIWADIFHNPDNIKDISILENLIFDKTLEVIA